MIKTKFIDAEEHRKLHNRLSMQRGDLRSLHKYTEAARDALWSSGAAPKGEYRIMFDLLIAVEGLHKYMRIYLDRDLKEHGMVVTNGSDYESCHCCGGKKKKVEVCACG